METVTFQLNWEPNGFQAPCFLAPAKFLAAAGDLQLTDHIRQAGWGNHDAKRWRNLGRTLSETDLLSGDIDVETVWTNMYLSATPTIREYTDRISEVER